MTHPDERTLKTMLLRCFSTFDLFSYSKFLPTIDLFDSPKECGMNTGECDIIGVWTLGSNGECQHEDHGILVGKGHYEKILMEHHWNNPTNEVNY